jgi:hypothetical protein
MAPRPLLSFLMHWRTIQPALALALRYLHRQSVVGIFLVGLLLVGQAQWLPFLPA